MGRSTKSSWIAGTVVVALLLAVAAWFLAISPVVSTASETREQAEAARQSNDQLATRVARLKEQFSHLDEYKAELAGLQLQIPSDAELAAYLRALDDLARTHSVAVMSVTPGEPAAIVAAAQPAATTDDTATDTATDETSTDTATTEPTAAAAAQATAGLAGVEQMMVALNVVGTYDNVMAFIEGLQTGTDRLLLVTSVSGTGQEDAEAGGGRPATSVGDLEVTVTGSAFVLPTATVTTPDPTATETPALPSAVPGKNPFVPAG